jgi:hypothetical protein
MSNNNCLNDVRIIPDDEYIGDSLKTINKNFESLKSSACDLEEKLDRFVNIRTFFYYGPNTPSDGDTSGLSLNTGVKSYPSNTTIENFVNNTNQLNLIPISETGDQVFVIYQKTGWYTELENHIRSGSGQVQFGGTQTYKVWVPRSIGICFAGGTMIQTPEGDKPIETLLVNDLVYSFDPQTKEKKTAKVVKTFKDKVENAKEISPLLHVKHEQGELLVTADHWIYMGIKECLFKAAKELTTNDYLNLENGERSKILSIETNTEHEYVYNINVEKYHNFIANNVLTGDYQTDDFIRLNSDKFRINKNNGVATPNGFIAIQDLNIKDEVYGFCPNTLELIKQEVLQKQESIENCVKITHECGEIILPESQLVFYNGRYKAAKYLTIEDSLVYLEDTDIYTPYYNIDSRILKIEKHLKETAYHLKISETQNFIYNGVFVHNAGDWVTKTKTVYQWQGYTWSTSIDDTYRMYAPIFVIYRLTFNGTQYVVDSGFPKFQRSSTNSTVSWNNPRAWTTY